VIPRKDSKPKFARVERVLLGKSHDVTSVNLWSAGLRPGAVFGGTPNTARGAICGHRGAMSLPKHRANASSPLTFDARVCIFIE
jgi:hypothetical protein